MSLSCQAAPLGAGPPYHEGARCGACNGPTNGYRCGCEESERMRVRAWPQQMSDAQRLELIEGICANYLQQMRPQFVPREIFHILQIAGERQD